MNKILFVNIVLGPTMLLIGLLFKLYPPKKINRFYGYRTPRSMKSPEAWKEGNRYSANMFLGTGILTCFVQASTYALFDPLRSIQISSIFLVAVLLAGIILTEIHLKRNGF